MTVTEFYEWAKENNVEDYQIVVNDCCGDSIGTSIPEQSVYVNDILHTLEL